jgi:hypothetical protein
VLAGLPQRVAELLVLGHGLGQLTLRLQQALLEGADPLRGIGHAGAQMSDLVVQRVDLGSHGLGVLVT